MFDDPHHVRQDFKMLEKAAKEKWSIPDALWELGMSKLQEVFQQGNRRQILAGIRAMSACARVNVEQTKIDKLANLTTEHGFSITSKLEIPAMTQEEEEAVREVMAKRAKLQQDK